MTLSVQTVVEVIGLAGTILVGGMKLGTLDSRLSAVELRKDQTEDVASVKAQVGDLKTDVGDMKRDIRDIKSYMLSHPK